MSLTWTEPFPGKPDYHAAFGRSDPSGVIGALVEAWARFLDKLEGVPPDRWSIVLAYLVAEIGSFSLYPTTREEPGSGGDDLSVTLQLDDWMAQYGAIHDRCYEGIDPDDRETSPSPRAEAKFMRQYQAFVKKMARSIKAAMSDASLAPRFAALKKRPRFAVYYVDQGETVHTANLVYLWGARPPKGFPADTPRILFTGLMHKASLPPANSLKFDGDHVIEAVFFGNEFNDKYVDILESIPDIGVLCARLRRLKLFHTKIKPAGVERLRALFPKARVIVEG